MHHSFGLHVFLDLGGKANYNLLLVMYQYHGGTNFGRSTGGPFISTSYDYDAPIDEYGMLDSQFFCSISYGIIFCRAITKRQFLVRDATQRNWVWY